MNKGTKKLDFGSDTLCLIRFISKIENDNYVDLSRIFVDVYGTQNNLSKSNGTYIERLSGQVSNCELNGYIRSLEVISEDGEKWSVGGSNATLEDFAAENICLTVPYDYYIRYHEPYLPFYLIDEKSVQECIIESELSDAIKNNTIDIALALSRRVHEIISFDYLVNCLQEPHSRSRMEFACEGFRSLEPLYKKNQEISERCFLELRNFIEKYKSSAEKEEYALSIVYAVESLGYVSRNSTQKLSADISTYLIGLAFNRNILLLHEHLLWSIVCSTSHTWENIKSDKIHRLRAVLISRETELEKHISSNSLTNYINIPLKIINSFLGL